MAVSRAADFAAQTPEVWSTKLYRKAEKKTTFWRYEGGPGSGMPIIRMDELSDKPGNTVHVDLVLDLTSAAIVGDTTPLEGNEDRLNLRQQDFTTTYIKNAVRWTELANMRNIHALRPIALGQLERWLAGVLDTRMWTEMTGNGSTTMPDANKWAAGTATSRATVADTNAGGRLTLDTLTEARAYAREELKIAPFMVDGDDTEWYLLLAHEYALMELKRDDTKWAQAQREARERAKTNPIFTGDASVWDGVIIKQAQRVPRSTNGTIQVADNLLLGQEAGMRGYSMYPSWRESNFDYGTEAGVAVVTCVGEKLNVFDLTTAGGAAASAQQAIGAMVVYSAAVAPTP